MQNECGSGLGGATPISQSPGDALPATTDPLAELRAAWSAENDAALEQLAHDLGAAATPTEMLAAQARFLRATARGFSRQVSDLAVLLQESVQKF